MGDVRRGGLLQLQSPFAVVAVEIICLLFHSRCILQAAPPPPALPPPQEAAAAALEAKVAELQAAATQHAQAIETKQAELDGLGQAKVGAGSWMVRGELWVSGLPHCTHLREPPQLSCPPSSRTLKPQAAQAAAPPSHRPYLCRRSCRHGWPTRSLPLRTWRRGLSSWRKTPVPRRRVLWAGGRQASGWQSRVAHLLPCWCC